MSRSSKQTFSRNGVSVATNLGRKAVARLKSSYLSISSHTELGGCSCGMPFSDISHPFLLFFYLALVFLLCSRMLIGSEENQCWEWKENISHDEPASECFRCTPYMLAGKRESGGGEGGSEKRKNQRKERESEDKDYQEKPQSRVNVFCKVGVYWRWIIQKYTTRSAFFGGMQKVAQENSELRRWGPMPAKTQLCFNPNSRPRLSGGFTY